MGDHLTLGDGMRSREEIEARRAEHMRRIVEELPLAVDPIAAAAGLAARAHELDWVLGRNEGL